MVCRKTSLAEIIPFQAALSSALGTEASTSRTSLIAISLESESRMMNLALAVLPVILPLKLIFKNVGGGGSQDLNTIILIVEKGWGSQVSRFLSIESGSDASTVSIAKDKALSIATLAGCHFISKNPTF